MVKKDYKYKVGDKLVGLKGVFEIVSIERKENYEGKRKEYYMLEPCIAREHEHELTIMVPVDSEEDVNKRKPLSRSKMDELLRGIKYGRITRKRPYSTSELWDMVFSNDPEKLKLVMIGLKSEAKKRGELSYSKKRVMDKAVMHLAEEVACSHRIQFDTATKKVLDALGKESEA